MGRKVCGTLGMAVALLCPWLDSPEQGNAEGGTWTPLAQPWGIPLAQGRHGTFVQRRRGGSCCPDGFQQREQDP